MNDRLAGVSRRGFLRGSAMAVTALAAGNALAACAASTTTGSSSGRTTISVMDGDPLPADISAFEKAHPDIKVQQLVYDPTRLQAMIAAGSPPDVVRGQGATDTPYLATFKLAAPLDDYVAKSSVLKAADLDPVNDLWRFDGTKQGAGPRYGLAKDYSQDNMFWFNPKPFAQAGVATPSTTVPISYDEWAHLAEQVSRKQGGQLAVFGVDSGEGHLFQHFVAMVHSAGGSLFSSDLTRVDFSSPEGQKALSWYVNLARTKSSMSVVTPAPTGGSVALLKANRIGMVDAGYWYTAVLNGDPAGDTCRLAPAPQFGTTRTSPTNSATGAWISAKSSHKDEAWQFLEFFLGPARAKGRAQAGTGNPTLISLRGELPSGTPMQQQALATQRAELPYLTSLSYTPYAQLSALEAALEPALVSSINSGQSTGKLADTLNSTLNSLIQQGKQNT